MEIELLPEPEAADPALSAAVAAIEQSGLADDERSAATVSAWRRAGVLEAVDRSPAPQEAATTRPGRTVPPR
jgi:hypothetical protein